MRTSFKLIGAAIMTAIIAQLLFGQATALKPVKVHVPGACYVDAECTEWDKEFRKQFFDLLRSRRNIVITESPGSADFIISFMVDKIPNNEETVYCNGVEVTKAPTRYILGMVITAKKSKNTFEKFQVQSYTDLAVMANFAYQVFECVLQERD